MVLRVVKQDLASYVLLFCEKPSEFQLIHTYDRKIYKKAFLACRKHRIDFSIFVEHDPHVFHENISSFVDQIDDVDHLNLFLTSIGYVSDITTLDIKALYLKVKLIGSHHWL